MSSGAGVVSAFTDVPYLVVVNFVFKESSEDERICELTGRTSSLRRGLGCRGRRWRPSEFLGVW